VTDLRLAIRSLARAPIFAAAIILTIALGVGATTAVFSIVYAALYRPLPYPDASRLVAVWATRPRNPNAPDQVFDAEVSGRIFVASPLLEAWRREARAFDDIAGFRGNQFTLTGAGEPVRIRGAVATASFFKVLGVRPLVGRLFQPGDDTPGHDEVIVLGHGFWKEHFNGDPKAVGATVRVDGLPHTVIGVLPADTRLPLQFDFGLPAFYTPMTHEFTPEVRFSVLLCVARLKPGKTIVAAQAEMSSVMRHLAATTMPHYRRTGARVVPLAGEVVDTVTGARRGLLILLAATACVLLIACVNVANLLLVRATTRYREIAIRTALGAGRWRVIRQMVVESLVLSIAGGVAGLLVAAWGADLLLALVPEHLFPRLEEVRLDATALAFGIFASTIAGLLAGLAPAWYALGRDRRGRLADGLKESHRAVAGARGTTWVRRSLVGVQVVLAMVLLVGAGLLARTYADLMRVDLGVRPDHVLSFRVTLDSPRYATSGSRSVFVDNVLARLRTVPGVQAAGAATSLPVLSFVSTSGPVAVDGRTIEQRSREIGGNYVTGGFFDAAGISLDAGRWFSRHDAPADAAVVSRRFARRFWPGAAASAALGHTVLVGNKTYRIIGVVGDVNYEGPDGGTGEDVYLPLPDGPFAFASVLVRTAGDPTALVPAVRAAVRAEDADVPLEDVRALEQVLDEAVRAPRFRLAVIGAFALLALMLAAVGLYGVIAQSVAQRTHEIGIRLALGAGRRRIASMILTEAVLLTAIGIVCGVVVSLAATRVLSSFLFGVTSSDSTTYALVAVTLLAVAVVACVTPARHASAIDPVVALRNE
jgi:predicted permease